MVVWLHRKNVLSTMMKSVVAAGVVSVLWVVVGLAFALAIQLEVLLETRNVPFLLKMYSPVLLYYKAVRQ